MKTLKQIANSVAIAVSVFLPIAPATSHKRDGSVEVTTPEDDVTIVDDGCEVPALKGGAARHEELEAATQTALLSCNPFNTAWGAVQKVPAPRRG
jgi:hypothetical protein